MLSAAGDKQAAVTAYIGYISEVGNIYLTVLAALFIENNSDNVMVHLAWIRLAPSGTLW